MNKPDVDFTLFTRVWQVLSEYRMHLVKFPHTSGSFYSRYGEFEASVGAETFISSLKNLNNLINLIDASSAVMNRSASIQASAPEQYKDVFSHSMELANQLNKAALEIESFLKRLNSGTGELPADHKVVQLGSGIQTISAVARSIDDLCVKITSIETALADALPQIQKNIIAIADSKLVHEANQTIGRLEQKNQSLQHKKKTGSLVNLFLSNKKEEEQRNELIYQNQDIIKKKKNFVADYNTPFLSEGNQLLKLLNDLISMLSKLKSELAAFSGKINFTLQRSSPEQFSDVNWLTSAINVSEFLNFLAVLKNTSSAYIESPAANNHQTR